MLSSTAAWLLKFSRTIPPKVTTSPTSARKPVVVSDSVLTGPLSESCIAPPSRALVDQCRPTEAQNH